MLTGHTQDCRDVIFRPCQRSVDIVAEGSECTDVRNQLNSFPQYVRLLIAELITELHFRMLESKANTIY